MNDNIESSQRLKLKWIYLAWVGMAFSSLVIGIIAGIFQGRPELVVAKLGISNFSIFAIALYSFGSGVAVIILFFLLKRQGLDSTIVGFRGKLTYPGIPFSLVGLIIAFILYPLIEAALALFGVPMFWRGGAASALHLSTTLDIVLILTFAVIVGPIAEEIIFRGYILNAFSFSSKRLISAYLWSALIFASAHLFVGPGTIVFIFFWSFIPSFLFLKFGNLYPGIYMHVLNNFITYLVFPLWWL